jgi:hypothetical protein
MRDLFVTAGLIVAAILVYGFRAPILRVLRRFDRRNAARQAEQMRERSDPVAHFRHTLQLAEEQVEEIAEIATHDERTATPVTRYVFQGEIFATRRDAEKARAAVVGQIARGFYADLPKALASRGNGKLGRD